MPYAYDEWGAPALIIHPPSIPLPGKDLLGCCGKDFEPPPPGICCAVHCKCCPEWCDCSQCPPPCCIDFCKVKCTCCDPQCFDCAACPPGCCKVICPPICFTCPPECCTAKCPEWCCNGCPPECCKAKCLGICGCCQPCCDVCSAHEECTPKCCAAICPFCPFGVQGCELGPIHASFLYCCCPQDLACCAKEHLTGEYNLKKGQGGAPAEANMSR